MKSKKNSMSLNIQYQKQGSIQQAENYFDQAKEIYTAMGLANKAEEIDKLIENN